MCIWRLVCRIFTKKPHKLYILILKQKLHFSVSHYCLFDRTGKCNTFDKGLQKAPFRKLYQLEMGENGFSPKTEWWRNIINCIAIEDDYVKCFYSLVLDLMILCKKQHFWLCVIYSVIYCRLTFLSSIFHVALLCSFAMI